MKKSFGKVRPEILAERRATGMRLEEILDLARGDPRMSAWEEGFLASMADILRQTDGHVELSEQQVAVLLKIEDKVRLPVPETEPANDLDG